MLDVTKRHLACAQTFAEKHEGDGIYIFYTPFYFFPFPFGLAVTIVQLRNYRLIPQIKPPLFFQL